MLIKIFEWHGVGQAAIAYANNEVGNIIGTDRVSVYLYESTKVHLDAIRGMMKALACRIYSTFLHLTLMISDQLCLATLILHIATKKGDRVKVGWGQGPGFLG